jgi:PAS domain S-box-containing protein
VARPPQVPEPETELEEFFDLSIDPLSILGFDGAFKRVNASFVHLLGYTRPELFSRTALDILHPDDVEAAREALAQLAEGRDLVGFEARVVCADGSVRWLEWNMRSMPERGVVYSVGRDTTELRRVDAELREAQRSLEASRDELHMLADEQAALRRVAVLVAQQSSPGEVFTAVTREVGLLLEADLAVLHVFQEAGTGATIAGWSGDGGPIPPTGSRFPLVGDSVAARIFETAAPARIDSYAEAKGEAGDLARSLRLRSTVGAPILVEGKLWGALMAATRGVEPFAENAETRIAAFTELVATAIANSESREGLRQLAAEQAALRRVATLVAQGASPSAVLDAVAAEMERALGADGAMLLRYEPDEEVTVVARRLPTPGALLPGTRFSHQGDSVSSKVRRTGRPARVEDYRRVGGSSADLASAAGQNSAVGAPIVVDGRLWGVIAVSWGGEQSPPGDTEERMAEFAQLLDTAIANADSRDQLTASRARLLTAGDEARRRVVRDLHDGAQQRLVHAIVTLKLAQRAARDNDGELESLLGEALDHAEQGNRELRDLAHGILPPALTRGGLRAGVDAVVGRLDLPVAIDVPAERLPAELEASAYFIVAEGLTNVIKHAHATRAEVKAAVDDGVLQVEVRDDGSGGADPAGQGLVGMADRVSALDGTLSVQSPAGAGTIVTATLPLPAA